MPYSGSSRARFCSSCRTFGRLHNQLGSSHLSNLPRGFVFSSLAPSPSSDISVHPPISFPLSPPIPASSSLLPITMAANSQAAILLMRQLEGKPLCFTRFLPSCIASFHLPLSLTHLVISHSRAPISLPPCPSPSTCRAQEKHRLWLFCWPRRGIQPVRVASHSYRSSRHLVVRCLSTSSTAFCMRLFSIILEFDLLTCMHHYCSPFPSPSFAPPPRHLCPFRTLALVVPSPTRRAQHLAPRSDGGLFKAKLSFPRDYPYMPPTMIFTSDMWHPNSTQKLPNHPVLSLRGIAFFAPPLPSL